MSLRKQVCCCIGEMMLLDAIATVILLGMMFIPLVNIIVGVVIGADLAGPPGALCGLLSALAISAAQRLSTTAERPAFGPAAGREPSSIFSPPQRARATSAQATRASVAAQQSSNSV